MSNYDKIPAITYLDKDLTQKWNRVIFTGEVYRAKVHEKALNSKDKSFDVSLKIPKEVFLALKKKKMDTTDKDGNVSVVGNRILSGLKKVELKVKDEEGEVLLNDEGDEVKEFSHFQITVRQNRAIKGQPVVIPVNDASDGSRVEDFLNEGSKVSILAQAYESEYEGKLYLGLNLKEVKVHELVAYEGGSGVAEDPWAVLGMSSSAPETTPEQEETPEVTEKVTSDVEFDAFSDDVPF